MRKLPEIMNGYQTLAWIAWRSVKAVRIFSGDDAKKLWNAAKQGRYPAKLGAPRQCSPVEAETWLRRQMAAGKVNPIPDDSRLH